MIRSEAEYRDAVQRLADQKARLEEARAKLRETLEAGEVRRALNPQRSFMRQIQDEIEQYQRIKRGEFPEITNLGNVGEYLIGLRIYQGISQKELAEKLGVDESQVSRDERNEYHNITLDRAAKIMDVLGSDIRMILRARAMGTVDT